MMWTYYIGMWTKEQIQEWRGQVRGAIAPLLFYEWLLKHDLDEVVGVARLADECPFCCYLRDVLPWLDIKVSRCQLSTDIASLRGWSSFIEWACTSTTKEDLPKLDPRFSDFIDLLDKRNSKQDETGYLRGQPVTAREAIAVFDMVFEPVVAIAC